MAILPESFKAFQYQTGIDRICDAYQASSDTMTKARREASQAYAQYMNDGVDDREYDDDGILIASTEHSLAQAEMEAMLAVSVVREAFVTSAFHYWERSARTWTGLHGRYDGFKRLRDECAKRYSVSPQLDNLNLLNNLLKHNSGSVDADDALLAERPDYFFQLFPSPTKTSPARFRLRLSHEHVEEVFDIVRASGPTY
ncbi:MULTISPECIES: hypothetical protein [Agrobacterium]|uniref:hypothetical protein n=1 Tax=Agrobacterium TaxID=357 RepID=UPI0027B8D246|nr:hypothetical protein [Agrobacterium sp. SORGH_AS_0745]